VGEQQKRAHDGLSQPLYVLFRQLDALCTSGDPSADVAVVDSEPLQGRPEEGDDDEGGRKRTKVDGVGGASTGGGAGHNESMFQVDDLAVRLTLRVAVEGNGDVLLAVRFQRLSKLNAITAEAEGFPVSLLASLLPGDSGLDFPASAHFQVAMGSSYPRETNARPFLWAQHLAGLGCLPEKQTQPRLEASSRMIFQRIHQRVATFKLVELQIESLSELPPGSIPVHPLAAPLFPEGGASTLASWTEVSLTGPEALLLREESDSLEESDPLLGGRVFVALFQGPRREYCLPFPRRSPVHARHLQVLSRL